MKSYRFFKQGKNMCLAACLQSVLSSRKLKMSSQQEISQKLNIHKDGINLDETLLNSFLLTYNLRCRFVRPSETMIEPDILLRGLPRDIDVLIFYDYAKLYSLDIEAGHFSLLADFQEGREKEIYLHDNLAQKVEQVSLPDLTNSMRTFRNCGFYLIGTEEEIRGLRV